MFSANSDDYTLFARELSSAPPTWTGYNLSELLNKWFDENHKGAIWLLADRNTAAHCLPMLHQQVPAIQKVNIILTEAGEQIKSIKSCENIWRTLTREGADRKSLLCNLGGGVIGDLGGFAASTFMRGIPFVQLPTSLLAMVDSSIGGKTGINFEGYKNLIGSFQQPAGIFIQTSFLESLPQPDLISGFAEMVKHALIEGKDHWEEISKLNQISFDATFRKLIESSVRLKLDITTRDFQEAGLREVLNLGHTSAHALESLYLSEGTQLMHGYAVAAGLAIETYIAREIPDMLSEEEAVLIRNFIYRMFPPVHFDKSQIDTLIHYMEHDKKNKEGFIHFSLLERIGQSRFGCRVPTKIIKNALLKYCTDAFSS